MRVGIRGQGPKPPIHHLTGLIPVEAGFGSSTFRMPVTPWLQTTVPGVMVGGVTEGQALLEVAARVG